MLILMLKPTQTDIADNANKLFDAGTTEAKQCIDILNTLSVVHTF